MHIAGNRSLNDTIQSMNPFSRKTLVPIQEAAANVSIAADNARFTVTVIALIAVAALGIALIALGRSAR